MRRAKTQKRIHAHATGLRETPNTAPQQPFRKSFPKPMIL